MKRQSAASTTVIGAGPNFADAAGCHRVAGRIQPEPKHYESDDNLSDVDERESDVFAAAEPRAPIQHEPHIAWNDKSEPRSEQGADEAQQITENRDGLRDDPSQSPGRGTDADPGACSDEATAVQVGRTPKQPQEDVFCHDVREYDSGDDDLCTQVSRMIQRLPTPGRTEHELTVGRATPHATLATVLLVLLSAGLATFSPP